MKIGIIVAIGAEHPFDVEHAWLFRGHLPRLVFRFSPNYFVSMESLLFKLRVS